MKNSGLLPIIFIALPFLALAQKQEDSSWIKKLEKYKIQPSLGIQLWSSYTLNQEVFNGEKGVYQAVDDRVNFQLRRTRVGLKGQAYENLSFNFTMAIDLVGRDLLSGTEAGVNNGASPIFRLWNAYVQWRMVPKSEKLNLAFGYLPPQIGRESITSALRSNSMEKSWSQNYLRRHLTGIGPGRAMGANFGGLFYKDDAILSMGYDLGIFTPQFESYGGNSVGKHFSPLWVARMEFYIGDPESKKYTLDHKINYFGKRNGLTLALAAAHQGETDLFLKSEALGLDFLWNHKNINLDGEWTWMSRAGELVTDDLTEIKTALANTGYLRLGYNIHFSNGFTLEPTGMVVYYNGQTDAVGQSFAATVKTPSGLEQIYDLGVNLYLNPDFKLSLHYTHRDGEPGDAGEGAIVNNYFYQAGLGAIHRGDWIGLGLVAIF